MHILSINFISFTAQFYNALHMQSKKATFGILGAWFLCSPKSAYVSSILLSALLFPMPMGHQDE